MRIRFKPKYMVLDGPSSIQGVKITYQRGMLTGRNEAEQDDKLLNPAFGTRLIELAARTRLRFRTTALRKDCIVIDLGVVMAV